MITKLEELKKHQLIEMVKSLWIEKKLSAIQKDFSEPNARIDLLEELILETALELDNNILGYFGYPNK